MSEKTTAADSLPTLPLLARLHISVHSAFSRLSFHPDGTFNRRLFHLLDFRAKPNPSPDSAGVRASDFTLDPSRNLWFRLFVPTVAAANDGAARLPVMVYFHGGGFCAFSAASIAFDALCRRFAAGTPAVVVSVDYRLAPENRFPAPYDDGLDVLRFLDSGGLARVDSAAAELADLGLCFVSGDSIGGNIAHHVARRWAASDDWSRVKVPGAVLIQPGFAAEERTESQLRLEGRVPHMSIGGNDWAWRAFLPEGADRDHEAANVFGPRADGKLEERFPPAMVVIGGYDPLQDWQRGYCEGLRERGKEVRVVEFEESVHGFYFLPRMDEQIGRLVEEVKRFAEERVMKK